jgi:hypothetical protein
MTPKHEPAALSAAIAHTGWLANVSLVVFRDGQVPFPHRGENGLMPGNAVAVDGIDRHGQATNSQAASLLPPHPRALPCPVFAARAIAPRTFVASSAATHRSDVRVLFAS